MLNLRQLGEVAALATAGILLLLAIYLFSAFILSHIALITLFVVAAGAAALYAARGTAH